ncbi:MAG: hypothetical protein HY909_22950 [Deltaproteobacteria bacterium]|nr:hypothetical protein [Deltaproteobacteria bacterium]
MTSRCTVIAAVGLLALWVAPVEATGQHRQVLEAGAPGVSEGALVGAFPGLRQHPDGGAVRLEGSWRWRPAVGQELVAWVACVGAGDSAGCMIGVGRRGRGGRVAVLLRVAAGWDRPSLAVGSTRATLVLRGSDGRCGWRRTVTWSVAGALRLGPRRCVA